MDINDSIGSLSEEQLLSLYDDLIEGEDALMIASCCTGGWSTAWCSDTRCSCLNHSMAGEVYVCYK
ncbi:hypothetical protein IJ182_01325 [bacterium]|nr:hypothetical protein [bacterium]